MTGEGKFTPTTEAIKPVGGACGLDVEIQVDQLYLTARGNLLRFPSREGLAQKFAEVRQRFIRFAYPVSPQQPQQDDDCVERIERKWGWSCILSALDVAFVS